MKKIVRPLLFVFVITSLVLAACGSAAPTEAPVVKATEAPEITEAPIMATAEPMATETATPDADQSLTPIATDRATPVPACKSTLYVGHHGDWAVLSTNASERPVEWTELATTVMLQVQPGESAIFGALAEDNMKVLSVKNTSDVVLSWDPNELLTLFYNNSGLTDKKTKVATYPEGVSTAMSLKNITILAVASPCGSTFVDPTHVVTEIQKTSANFSLGKTNAKWAYATYNGTDFKVESYGG